MPVITSFQLNELNPDQLARNKVSTLIEIDRGGNYRETIKEYKHPGHMSSSREQAITPILCRTDQTKAIVRVKKHHMMIVM